MPSTPILLSVFLALAALLLGAVLYVGQSDANENGLLIAVFSPGTQQREMMQTIASADGSFVRTSIPSNIVIAQGNGPDFADRLKQSGVWLTYQSAPFGEELAGCLALATTPFVRSPPNQRAE